MKSLVIKSLITLFCVFLLPFSFSCHQENDIILIEKKAEYRNTEMLKTFSPNNFLPQNTTIAPIPEINQNWLVGDFDGDFLGEILFAFHYPNNPSEKKYMGAILLKQEEGNWIKKYEYRVEAEGIYIAKACDITGDVRVDLVLGWSINSPTKEKQIFLYRWQKKELESIGNFTCSDITIDDFNGIYGKDGQFEFGIWTKTEATLVTDIFRWNDYTTLPILFPSEYGQSYTQQKLTRAEDLEIIFNRDFVIPKLLFLQKTYPNEPLYDFALIEAYLKAQLTEDVFKKIESSGEKLYQDDYEKIPFLKAQAYFIKGEVSQGNKLLQTELKKTINRVDAGKTLQLLGRSYVKAKDWKNAIIAFNNAGIFHIPFQKEMGFDSENQFQLSLAKDKARMKVMEHYWDSKDKMNDKNYSRYFQNLLLSSNQSKSVPLLTIYELCLPLNDFNDPYATVISWKENGKQKEILFMSIDEDQHKLRFNYAPTVALGEKTNKGWRLFLTFQEKNVTTRTPGEFKKEVLWEKNNWMMVTVQE